MSSSNIPYTLPNSKLWRRETVEGVPPSPNISNRIMDLSDKTHVWLIRKKKKKKRKSAAHLVQVAHVMLSSFPWNVTHPHAYTIMLIFFCRLDFSFCRILVQKCFARSKIHSNVHTYTRPHAHKKGTHPSIWTPTVCHADSLDVLTPTDTQSARRLTTSHAHTGKPKITQRLHLLQNLHN